MYQGTNTLNAHCSNESRSRRKSRKKVFSSPNRKSNVKHSRKKRWEPKHNNSYMKHSKYESDYIGPNRLTKHMGFLAKGKISDSISRLEEIVPKNLKARAKQDLRRVLKVSIHTKTNAESENLFQQTNHYIQNQISSSEESNPCSPRETNFSSPIIHFANGAQRQRLRDLSLRLNGKQSVLSSGNKSSSQNTPQQGCDDISLCREIITKKLHPAIASANSLLFPNVSNQKKLKNEFLAIKRQYEARQKNISISSSSNCESSQGKYHKDDFLENSVEDNFQLNPVLTQETVSPKHLENIFPNSQDFSSESENEVYVDAGSLLRSKLVTNRNVSYIFENKPASPSSDSDDSIVLFPKSVSSNGSPVWVLPRASPVKFVPDFPPTPKLYYRQKMF